MAAAQALKEFVRRITPEPIWVTVKKLRRDYALSHFPARVEKHTYHGYPLSVYVADGLGEGWYGRDWEPLPELELLSQHRLKAGATVFDLGAHQFVVAQILGKIVGPAGRVIGLEASQWDAGVGRRNVELNQPNSVTVIHGAIADKSGEVEFALDGHVSDDQRKAGRVRVRAYTIDELAGLYGQPDVLFIDVEGYEGKALEGAAETLRKRPDCFVEVHVGKGLEFFGGTVDQILSFFPAGEYDLFVNPEDGKAFEPLVQGSPVLTNRFFLVALARNSNRN